MTPDELTDAIHAHTKFRVTHVKASHLYLGQWRVYVEARSVYGVISEAMRRDLLNAGLLYCGDGISLEGPYLMLDEAHYD